MRKIGVMKVEIGKMEKRYTVEMVRVREIAGERWRYRDKAL
jgi:hypothetical protein